MYGGPKCIFEVFLLLLLQLELSELGSWVYKSYHTCGTEDESRDSGCRLTKLVVSG